MAGGVSGAASGGVLGLVLLLLAQQFGYVVFSSLEQTLIFVVLVIFVFAVVLGILGRVLKASAIRRAKAGARATSESSTTPPTASGAPDTGTGTETPPSEPGAPPTA
jgi:hypothetical protein